MNVGVKNTRVDSTERYNRTQTHTYTITKIKLIMINRRQKLYSYIWIYNNIPLI